jgi:hypothetical protein
VYQPRANTKHPSLADLRSWRDDLATAAYDRIEILDRLRPRAASGQLEHGDAWDDTDLRAFAACVGQIRDYGIALAVVGNRYKVDTRALIALAAEPLRTDPLLLEQACSCAERICLAMEIGDRCEQHTVVQLQWAELTPEDFERLLFNLVSSAPGYANPQWLTHTNAPDRGRDLDVWRVSTDSLAGVHRHRVVIACKHWLSKSIGVLEASSLRAQVKLHEPPTVAVLVMATSGRFTADAVAWIEKENQQGGSPQIEMWPENHLERLLTERPNLVAEFRLRQ